MLLDVYIHSAVMTDTLSHLVYSFPRTTYVVNLYTTFAKYKEDLQAHYSIQFKGALLEWENTS